MSWLETKVPPVIWWAWGTLITFFVDETFGDDLADGWGRVLGVVCLVAGVGIAVAALTGFGRAKTTVDPHHVSNASTLVTDGIYRFTRNPMYLGLLLLLVGWGFWRGTLLGLVLGAGAFVGVLTRVQIIPEERVLGDKFGDTYTAFTERTRRWL